MVYCLYHEQQATEWTLSADGVCSHQTQVGAWMYWPFQHMENSFEWSLDRSLTQTIIRETSRVERHVLGCTSGLPST